MLRARSPASRRMASTSTGAPTWGPRTRSSCQGSWPTSQTSSGRRAARGGRGGAGSWTLTCPAGGGRCGGAAGRADWAEAEGVDAVVDATHPFAETMSAHAVSACTQVGMPLLRLARPGWHPQEGDDWHDAGSLADAAAILPTLGTRVFLTTGRQGLPAFAALDRLWFLIRCVDPPSGAMPANREVLLARGPYAREAEHALMRRFPINLLVTNDSGGRLTAGKLAAARDLGIPVVMVCRPAAAPAVRVTAVDDAVSWVLDRVPARARWVPARAQYPTREGRPPSREGRSPARTAGGG